jgi:hypothetical protein
MAHARCGHALLALDILAQPFYHLGSGQLPPNSAIAVDHHRCPWQCADGGGARVGCRYSDPQRPSTGSIWRPISRIYTTYNWGSGVLPVGFTHKLDRATATGVDLRLGGASPTAHSTRRLAPGGVLSPQPAAAAPNAKRQCMKRRSKKALAVSIRPGHRARDQLSIKCAMDLLDLWPAPRERQFSWPLSSETAASAPRPPFFWGPVLWPCILCTQNLVSLSELLPEREELGAGGSRYGHWNWG